jgi:hypothetical protein
MTVYSFLTEISMSLFLLLHVKKKFVSLNCILRQLLIDEPLANFLILDSSECFHVQEIIDVYDKAGRNAANVTKSQESLSQQRRRARKW